MQSEFNWFIKNLTPELNVYRLSTDTLVSELIFMFAPDLDPLAQSVFFWSVKILILAKISVDWVFPGYMSTLHR